MTPIMIVTNNHFHWNGNDAGSITKENIMNATTTTTTATETKEVYGVVRFIAPGRTKASYVKRVDVCSNLPVGTSIGKALVMRESFLAQLVANMNRRGYVAQFVPTNHTCTWVNGQAQSF